MRVIFITVIICFASLSVFGQSAPEGLFIGSKASDFKGKDQNDNEIRLKDLLKKGDVVLVFYRGYWCPFCNKELSRLQDSLKLITDKGATLIAITPEKPASVEKTIEKTKASFSIIYDEDMKIMKAYDVAFEVPQNTVTRYRNVGLDLADINGKNGNNLPVPAVYIIGSEQTVTYRFFDPDYKKRPSVKEIAANLSVKEK
ncbi:MAG TPA: peroxiredoxin-like family protein [Chitinophagaceae bacterium]|nr:peroxiredoxin-like family protein [Chitinophagaceae bacterium]